MKKIAFLLLALGLGFVQGAKAQGGKVFDAKVMKSEILNGDRKFSIYLPEGYENSERSYPVLYLLHPAGPRGTVPNQQAWIHYGEIKQYLDKAIAQGEIVPMIVVTPDANSGSHISYYNDANGKFNFEDFFIKEFVPYIEKTYRVRAEKGARAIAGASAGGGGALYYAFHHPEMFTACCGLSAGIREYGDNIRSRFPEMKEEAVKEWYKQYNMYEAVKNMPENQKNQFKLYIDCGDDDALAINNALFHDALNKAGYQHELRIMDGAHNWTYWRQITPSFMQFVSKQFKQ
ncbi:MAG: esterase family protein [Bacteroidaceae bacterium]|nr:esterase family protein [Bacteroidaceae bacterium]MCF0186721.1 esterase family protein [Bacteroidaceae bacterium]